MSSPPISSSPTAVDPDTDVLLKSDPKPGPDIDAVTEPELDAEPAHVDPPDHSKREYLLAQIRQKDAIIESLLKQVSACKSVGFLLLSHVVRLSPMAELNFMLPCSCGIGRWFAPTTQPREIMSCACDSPDFTPKANPL